MNDFVLGIESSCDETSAAVVDRGGQVFSSVVISQAELHEVYGGVYPELASRAHIQKVLPAVQLALDAADIDPTQLHSIGVTRGPGLIGSLLVGVDTARALGLGWGVPVLGINHLRGHLRSADLELQRVEYPALVVLVSGGHTILAYMENPASILLAGSTVDDSIGEAYDKVARMMGLGYPGGPVVDRLASRGNPRYSLPRPMIRDGLNFSFSGLKTAVRRLIEREPEYLVEDLCASFVQSVLDVLLYKSRIAIERFDPTSLVVVGGVAASPPIRAAMSDLCVQTGTILCLPPVKWATDNAAMIALATWDYIDLSAPCNLTPTSSLGIEDF